MTTVAVERREEQLLPLPVEEQEELARREARCENLLHQGRKLYIELGREFLAIHAGKLYRGTHRRWDDYVRERWEFDQSYAHRLMTAVQVADNVAAIGGPLPANEGQARELAKAGGPEQQRETWLRSREMAESRGETLTLRHVQQAVMEAKESAEKTKRTAELKRRREQRERDQKRWERDRQQRLVRDERQCQEEQRCKELLAIVRSEVVDTDDVAAARNQVLEQVRRWSNAMEAQKQPRPHEVQAWEWELTCRTYYYEEQARKNNLAAAARIMARLET